MMIEIKGSQFVNKGAELMVHAVIQQIKQRWPEAELVMAANPNSPYVERAKLGAYQKLSLRKNIVDLNIISYKLPKKFRHWLKHKWGIITEADITHVFDASGFAYGDQWGSLTIKALAGEISRSKAHGQTYIFLPQALGPFTRTKDVSYLKRVLPEADLICAREDSSFKHVRDLIGDSPNLYKFPDFTNLVKGVLPEYFVDGQDKVLIIPNSNMISSRNNHSAWKENYLRVLNEAVSVVESRGLKAVLLNHEGTGDGEICDQVNQAAGGRLELIHEPNPLKVKGIIGASHAVICSRFHGCVSALSQGVPCIGTSWSHKYERLYEEYLQSECLIQPEISKEDLSKTLDIALELSNGQAQVEVRNAMKTQSEDLWQVVSNKLI
ncbi:polysaccharide pyruvyl transferase family protein [Shewanella waksmanii]|uniref:polysaccharide pyruvyl transferase family protein n=1 Tax=Shewanella waksmanii TaxID=213783 RepID=UPI00048BCFF5|nr:polysaccharide pyruvyl transferase family protein [Shewanella waksmanii]